MKTIFGSVVSVALLAIYVYLIRYGIEVSICVGDDACSKFSESDFNDRMSSSLALIGGLVSALVIAELAVTKPGQLPTERLIDPNLPPYAKNITKIITGVYLAVWLLAGSAAFYFGYLIAKPGVMSSLADLGQSWFGIAVGAGYAYFGIKQE